MSSCPAGYYEDNSDYSCKSCMANCLTCSDALTCDTCNSFGLFPYFYNSNCVSSCPVHYYASGGMCL